MYSRDARLVGELTYQKMTPEIQVTKILAFFFAHFGNVIKHIIAMKFDTPKRVPKVNFNIKFSADPVKTLGVMTDYSCKNRMICCLPTR